METPDTPIIAAIKRQAVTNTIRFGFCPLCGGMRDQGYQAIDGEHEPVCSTCFLKLYNEYSAGGVVHDRRDRQGAFLAETDLVLATTRTHVQIGMMMFLDHTWKVLTLWRYGGPQDGALHETRAWENLLYPLYITLPNILVIKVLDARYGQEFKAILETAYPPPPGSDKPASSGQMDMYNMLGL